MGVCRILASLLCILIAPQFVFAHQHCPPIIESYLSEISVKHDFESMTIRVEYTKWGGQSKSKYQAYLLAYLDKHAAQVPAAAPHAVINKEIVVILRTQLIEKRRKKEGEVVDSYAMEVKLDADDLDRLTTGLGIAPEQARSQGAKDGSDTRPMPGAQGIARCRRSS